MSDLRSLYSVYGYDAFANPLQRACTQRAIDTGLPTEETGLIVPIGAWALRTAWQQNEAWRRAGLGPLRVAVTLSARQFSEPDLVQTVGRVLDDAGLAADPLEIELTESTMMADVESAIETMRCLKNMG